MKKLLTICLLLINAPVYAHSVHHQHDEHTTNTQDLAQVRELMTKARELADEDIYREASKRLDQMKVYSQEARLYRAEIQQHFHEFDKALHTLADSNESINAAILKANILYTQGKFDEQLKTCKLLFKHDRQLTALTCLSQAMSLQGKLEESYALLGKWIESVDSSADMHWSYVTMAEMAERLNYPAQAIAYYRKAIALQKNDLASRLALADILLETQQYDEALKLTRDYLQHDAALLRYVRALNIQGDPRTSDHFCELKRRVLNYAGKKEHLHYDLLAEYYLYFSDQYEEAMNWANRHWKGQKTPRDARLLAKVSNAAGDFAVSEMLKNWQRQNKLQDSLLNRLI